MVFARNNNADKGGTRSSGKPFDNDEVEEVETTDDEATETDETDASTDAADTDDSAVDDDAEWAELDTSKDWREEGPFDIDEVDLDDDEVQRLDFGALIITPIPECNLQLQKASEEAEEILSAVMMVPDLESALEISAFAAPRSPGMWSEIRQQIIAQTAQAGGSTERVAGPFGTELKKQDIVELPSGERAIQPSRTWVAEGPRWLLRGVLYGKAAMTDEFDDDVVGPFYDAFRDVIVRRGSEAKPVGDLLTLTLPEELVAVTQEAASEDQNQAE